MSELKKLLTKLNKDRAEEDKIKVASDQPKDYFKTSCVSTGSPYLDYRIQKTTGKGGFVRGAFNLLVGSEGAAKSSLALIAASNEQKETGKTVVYFDGEGSISDSYLNRFGINRELFIHHKGRNLESMLDAAEAFSKLEEVGMIVFDSIPIFTSSAVEAKTAEDNFIAIEARKWTARFALIEGNAIRRNICLLGLSFYTLDPGKMMGDPRVLKRGKWQLLASNLTLDITKKDILRDESKDPIGHVIDVRIKKSKLAAYDARESFQINFYYEDGFNETEEYFNMLCEEGIISRGGAYYSFELPPKKGDKEPTMHKIMGKVDTVQFLKGNVEVFESLKAKL